jgi:hypothetical protein
MPTPFTGGAGKREWEDRTLNRVLPIFDEVGLFGAYYSAIIFPL